MLILRDWIQTFFEEPLPEAKVLADALTFHAFEVEGVEDDVLDVSVTPNRGHDCLSHRGIAKELSAILSIPMKSDPLRLPISLKPKTDLVKVTIEESRLCSRFTGAHIRGIRVGPSPEWLRARLEAVEQKSINNVVDAANYVMLDIGQPLHAFDVGKLEKRNNSSAMTVRLAKRGERLLGLDDKEYKLAPSMLVIVDENAGVVASIAGVKGGKPTGVGETTTDIFLESANFNGTSVRTTAAALKLRTDASDRFQQVISPELAAYGLRAAADLIVELAGGEIIGFVDEYPNRHDERHVIVSTKKVNQILGTDLSDADVANVFARLNLQFEKQGEKFTVSVPFERLDIEIPEDLVEEVGRIVGYERIPAVELSPFSGKPEVNPNFYAAEKAREELIAKGYSEVYTSVFAEKGERAVLNKIGGEKPFLRTTLVDGLKDALERNERNKDLLGLKEIRVFELGEVWKGGREVTMLGTADEKGVHEEPLPMSGDTISRQAYQDFPVSKSERYQPFSRYPSMTRDISLWVPEGTSPDDVLAVVQESAGELLVRADLFDRFDPPAGGERMSLAFRLVFQSFDRTLMDEDANSRMKSIYAAVKKRDWGVR